MAIHSRQDGGGFIWSCSGIVSPQEFYDQNSKLWMDGGFKTARFLVIDGRDADFQFLSDVDIVPWSTLYTNETGDHSPKRVAFATADPAVAAFADRFIAVFTDAGSRWVFSVFERLPDAIAWATR
jgi:hypothetical protein